MLHAPPGCYRSREHWHEVEGEKYDNEVDGQFVPAHCCDTYVDMGQESNVGS
jgi:hypothetical protein